MKGNKPGQGASQLPAANPRPGQGASQLPVKGAAERPAVSTRPAKKPNDVLADRSGNVYRKAGNEWQQRDKSGWSKPTGGKASDFAKSRPQLERDNLSRQRGQQAQSKQNVQRGGSSAAGSRQPTANGPRKKK